MTVDNWTMSEEAFFSGQGPKVFRTWRMTYDAYLGKTDHFGGTYTARTRNQVEHYRGMWKRNGMRKTLAKLYMVEATTLNPCYLTEDVALDMVVDYIET